MQIGDIMTQNVISVKPQDTIERAAQLMNERNVGSLPVCEENKVVGIITDRDIVMRGVAAGRTAVQTVHEIMTANPVTTNSFTDVREAAKIMSQHQIRRLPIVDNNSLVGMVALGDLAVKDSTSGSAGQALGGISTPSIPNV